MGRDFKPHDYQVPALEHLLQRRRAALLAPMGGGKTVMTLTAAERLDAVEPVYPMLVLAPQRVANTTWPDEAAKWSHLEHLEISPISWRRNPKVSATAKERAAALRRDVPIFTMAYDSLEWLVAEVGDSWPFRTVVADELTRLKSFRIRQGGRRAAALGKVAHSKVGRFWGLTGTPNPNGLKDLWGQVWFLDQGERLGRTFAAFEARWFRRGWDGYSLEPTENAQREIQERIADLCLTVDGLPVDAPIESIVTVKLPPAVRAMYGEMERELFATIEREGVGSIEVEASNAAVRSSKCLQIAAGFVFTDGGDWEELHAEKINALESIVEEAAGANILVSHQFVPDRVRLLRHFRQARELDADPDTLTQWNAGRIPLLLAHPASAGHGLNMQDGGNILADFTSGWNLEHDMQIIERIGPLRQKQSGYDRPVFRYRIIAEDTIDEIVLERLQSKKSVQEVLLEALRRKKRK